MALCTHTGCSAHTRLRRHIVIFELTSGIPVDQNVHEQRHAITRTSEVTMYQKFIQQVEQTQVILPDKYKKCGI